MPTVRSKLSKKNKYYIPEHRFLELKHFCLQYPKWQEALRSVTGIWFKEFKFGDFFQKSNDIFDPTYKSAMISDFYSSRIKMIEKAAKLSDSLLDCWILAGVTEGRSYDNLKMMYDIPCDRNTYYDRYRKFFYILDLLQKSNN